jgi:hypothetical protein
MSQSEVSEILKGRKVIAHDVEAVLTSYLVGMPDPQRGQWTPNYADTRVLRESVARHGQRLVIISDCFQSEVTSAGLSIENIPQATINPYFQRWLCYYQYLRDHDEVGKVFCVDATDVEMLRNPFDEMQDLLYTGDEPSTLANPWMRQHHPVPSLTQFFIHNRHKPLLNAGLLGGARDLVMEFAHEIVRMYFDNGMKLGDTDMGTFNYVAYNEYASRLSHGRHVNTIFKSFDYNNKESWWRHK